MVQASKIRLGLIGLGNIGNAHIRNCKAGKVPSVELVALCDINPDKLTKFPDYKHFNDASTMIKSGEVDAILVAVPHPLHPEITIEGFENGLHVLCEKPLAVHKADAERMIAAYENRPNKDQVFGAMFQLRTDPKMQKIRQLINDGEIGELRRVNWIITDWYRTQSYYNSGGWRATWEGEGGGILLNQCPHNMDMITYLLGLPSKVTASIGIGKYHNIEVEDDFSALLEYPNGATGIITATTGEAPGTDRLEIVGTRGKLVAEDGELKFWQNRAPTDKHLMEAKGGFTKPECWKIDVPLGGSTRPGGEHAIVLEDFAKVALGQKKNLLAAGVEGIKGVELACSILYAGLTKQPVELPLDSAAYEAKLKELIAESKAAGNKKEVVEKNAEAADFANSY